MKTTIIFLMATAISLFAAEAAQNPKPIPADRQEAISRLMLSVQQSQANANAAEKMAEQKIEEYKAALQKLQKEFNAEGCDLTFDKQWSCPKPVAK